MAKLGFKPGQTLGKQADEEQDEDKETEKDGSKDSNTRSRAEPLNLTFKEDRGGIGLDSERKRKFREEAEEVAKKVKVEQGDYRDRVRLERETKRAEAQVHAAQKVAEQLDANENGVSNLFSATDAEDQDQDQDQDKDQDQKDKEDNADNSDKETNESKPKAKVKPTSQINVIYRGLVREREAKEREVQTRHMLQTSLPTSFFPNPRLPGYDDGALDREDREALGGGLDLSTVLEQELEEEDPELDGFNALEPAERLRQLVQYLREKHFYCFWCKYGYETAEMEGCPGVTEEDHD